MDICVIGAGMMGRAITFDLCKNSNFENVIVADRNQEHLESAKHFLQKHDVDYAVVDVNKTREVTSLFQRCDIVISAIPYTHNYFLAKTAVATKTHFLDLGGNNDVVEKERNLYVSAKEKKVTIIPDCGLAPGMTSVIVKDIVEQHDEIDFVKIRVGGLPVNPYPPLNYQIVFSPYGLINEYVEDAIVLEEKKILKKKSMTEVETVTFPSPFGEMEAFLTSGGCSTLPFTYKDRIGFLDYKTIRYPGHCELFKTFLDMGFADNQSVVVGETEIVPRDLFALILLKSLPQNEQDVVLIKVLSQGRKNNTKLNVEYQVIDYFDDENNITSMMRTTGYPVSITAQMIQQEVITEHGVFGSEEIVPCTPYFKELEKRNIRIKKTMV